MIPPAGNPAAAAAASDTPSVAAVAAGSNPEEEVAGRSPEAVAGHYSIHRSRRLVEGDSRLGEDRIVVGEGSRAVGRGSREEPRGWKVSGIWEEEREEWRRDKQSCLDPLK